MLFNAIYIHILNVVASLVMEQDTGPWFDIKMTSYQHRKSHCGDKTILRPFNLHNGISYTGKMTSLYWIRAQMWEFGKNPVRSEICWSDYHKTGFCSQSWWRHQMETFSALLAICAGNSPVPGEFPAQRPVTRSFDVCFDIFILNQGPDVRVRKKPSKVWNLLEWLSQNCFLFPVMMTSSNGNIFRVTGHLCGKFTGPRWISRTKASDAELWCLLWFASE